MPTITGRPGTELKPFDFEAAKADLKEEFSRTFDDKDAVSYALYPAVFKDFERFRQEYGPVSKLGTRNFLIGPKVAEEFSVDLERGKTLHIKILAVSDLKNNGARDVFFELNGQLRSVEIIDKVATKDIRNHPKALKGVKGSVGSPMPGEILDIRVKEGDKVMKGQPLCIISAMKMEMTVNAPIDGVVKTIHIATKMKLTGDDLMFDLE